MTREGVTTCGRCGVTWTGYRAAHCGGGGCHETFTSPASFDMHLDVDNTTEPATATHHPPAEVGLTRNSRGLWAVPISPDALARLSRTRIMDEPPPTHTPMGVDATEAATEPHSAAKETTE